MSAFKTKFNFFAISFRITLFLTLLLLCVYFIAMDEIDINEGDVFGILFGISLLVLFFRDFKKYVAKRYTISEDYIEEYNIITKNKRQFYKTEIKGFSTSLVPYKIGEYKEIIIYLLNNDKLEIIQFFAYNNFKDIQPELIRCNYVYWGYEEYIWQWFDGRIYHFDQE